MFKNAHHCNLHNCLQSADDDNDDDGNDDDNDDLNESPKQKNISNAETKRIKFCMHFTHASKYNSLKYWQL